jgi:hypothetical protein
MKRAIMVAIMVAMLPTAALGWGDRDFYDSERNQQLGRIASEMERANDYQEYRDAKENYESEIRSQPEWKQPMIRHYNPGPQPPKR